MRKIGHFILTLMFIYLYIKVLNISVLAMQLGLPFVLIGTWRTYVIWGLAYTGIEAVFLAIFYLIGWCISKFQRGKITKVICTFATIVATVNTIMQLWQYIDALYYAGFWEFFLGALLTLEILIFYIGLGGMCLFMPYKKSNS